MLCCKTVVNGFLLVARRFESIVPCLGRKVGSVLTTTGLQASEISARGRKWLLLHSFVCSISRTVTINRNYQTLPCPCCTLLLLNTTLNTIKHYVFMLYASCFQRVIWKHPYHGLCCEYSCWWLYFCLKSLSHYTDCFKKLGQSKKPQHFKPWF